MSHKRYKTKFQFSLTWYIIPKKKLYNPEVSEYCLDVLLFYIFIQLNFNKKNTMFLAGSDTKNEEANVGCVIPVTRRRCKVRVDGDESSQSTQ